MAKGKYEEWLKPEGLLKMEGWARDGLTDEDIAANMGIAVSTLYDWKNKYPELVESLKEGKDIADRRVENALYKSALGYQYDEVTKEINGDTGQMVITKIVTKQVQPNTTAQIFWLKNRKPAEWRDKRDIDLSGGVNVNNPYEGLTTDELKKLIHDG